MRHEYIKTWTQGLGQSSEIPGDRRRRNQMPNGVTAWILLSYHDCHRKQTTHFLVSFALFLWQWQLNQGSGTFKSSVLPLKFILVLRWFLNKFFITLVFDNFIYVYNRSVHTHCSQYLFYSPKSQLLPISPHPTLVSFCPQFGFKSIHWPDLKLIPGPWATHNDYTVEDNDFPFFSTLDC